MQEAKPRRGRDGAQTRQRICEEALKLFAEKGYEATSVRDISTAVGVADAALYRHFPSKADIARAVFNTHYGELASDIGDIRERDLPLAESVGELVALLCDLFDERPQVFTFILLNQHDHLRFIDDRENAVAELIAIMSRARTRGEHAVDDAELAASMALGVALQPAVFKLYGRLPGPLRVHREVIARAVLGALKGAGSGV